MLFRGLIGAGGSGAKTATEMTFIKRQEVSLGTNMTISTTDIQDGDLLIVLLFVFNSSSNLAPEVYPPNPLGTGWSTIFTKNSVTGSPADAHGVYFAKYESGVTQLTTNTVTDQGVRHLCLVFRPDIPCNYYSADFNYEFTTGTPAIQVMDQHTDKARVSYVVNLGYTSTPSIVLSNELFESFVGSQYNRYAYGISNADENSSISVSSADSGSINSLLSGIIYADT